MMYILESNPELFLNQLLLSDSQQNPGVKPRKVQCTWALGSAPLGSCQLFDQEMCMLGSFIGCFCITRKKTLLFGVVGRQWRKAMVFILDLCLSSGAGDVASFWIGTCPASKYLASCLIVRQKQLSALIKKTTFSWNEHRFSARHIQLSRQVIS